MLFVDDKLIVSKWFIMFSGQFCCVNLYLWLDANKLGYCHEASFYHNLIQESDSFLWCLPKCVLDWTSSAWISKLLIPSLSHSHNESSLKICVCVYVWFLNYVATCYLTGCLKICMAWLYWMKGFKLKIDVIMGVKNLVMMCVSLKWASFLSKKARRNVASRCV